MKKIFLLTVLLFQLTFVFGQSSGFQKIKIIEWNYSTKTFKNNEILENLKVNDVVQILLKHLPKKYETKSNITFLNNHLEMRGSFGQNIAFGKNEQDKTPTNTKSSVESTKNEVKEADVIMLQAILKSTFVKNKNDSINALKLLKTKLSKIKVDELKEQIEKTNKINDKNLDKALEINSAKSFIEKTKENEKAKEDIDWQKKLILIAQKNWQNQLEVRDDMIEKLAKNIDSLTNIVANKNAEIEKIDPRETKYFAPFKIENYDFTEFTIEITDKTDDTKPIETTLIYNFKNKRGFKLDFSTGILATGLYSPSYKFYSKGTTIQIKEEANPTSKFNTGIALMAHAYTRSGGYLNIGVGSGFSYNLDSQNLNYLLGGSLLWGEEQRIITTIGVNVGRVKELSNYYKIDQDYTTTEFTVNSTVPTVDVLKASWFISITYNLGISNTSKTKKL